MHENTTVISMLADDEGLNNQGMILKLRSDRTTAPCDLRNKEKT